MSKIRVDIVIPAYFGLGLTTRVTRSAIKNCDFEKFDISLILVDDSGDEKYNKLLLKSIEKIDPEGRVKVLKHDKNLGFIEACYTGIQNRKSEYKLLLNSDTFLLPESLEEMIAVAESDNDIAIVNPVTNNIPVIDIAMPPGMNIYDMNQFIQQFPNKDSDYIDIVTSVGFCMLIKSAYIDQFGFFDRIFGYGYGEDTDLHFRYISKGKRAVIATKSFVYHRGEGSFGDRDEKVVRASEIVFGRYKDLYDKTFPKFVEKTVLNRMRSSISEVENLSTKILFLTKNNSLSDMNHRYAHLAVNTLLESEVSANIAYVQDVATLSYIDDRMYTPAKLEDLHKFRLDLDLLVVMDHTLYSHAVELAISSLNSSKKVPKIVYLGDLKKLSDKVIVDEISHLYDDVKKISMLKVDNSLPIPEVLDIYSNIGMKRVDSSSSNARNVMVSSRSKFVDVVELAKHFIPKRGEQVIFYKFGNKSKVVELDNVSVNLIKWPDTAELYRLLKETDLFVDPTGNFSDGELALMQVSAVPMVLNSRSKSTASKELKTIEARYVDFSDSLQASEELLQILDLERDYKIGDDRLFESSIASRNTLLAYFDKISNKKEKIDLESHYMRVNQVLKMKKNQEKSVNEQIQKPEEKPVMMVSIRPALRYIKHNIVKKVLR